MKLLFDQNLSAKLCRDLSDLFPSLGRSASSVWLRRPIARFGKPRTRANLLTVDAFSLVTSGCYLLATLEAYNASLRPDVPMDKRAA